MRNIYFQKNIYLLVLLFVLPILCTAQENSNQEEVIVFIQKSKESDFTIKKILELEVFIRDLGIPVKVVDIEAKGAPKEVKYTPFIVYQNYLGRKIYKGRYTTLNRLKNFITTVQYIPSDVGKYPVSNALVWKEGRTEFFVQTKITPLEGEIPDEFNPALFMKEAWEGIHKGMEGFNFYLYRDFLLENEIFYLNYYPHITYEGKLYLTYEIYSHYDCITPIYVQGDIPIKTSITGTKRAFYLVAKEMKENLLALWKNSEAGDALSFVDAQIKTVNWEELGFNIPQPPIKPKAKAINIDAFRFVQKWEYTSAASRNKPAVQFYFPPPIHQYSGYLADIQGSIFFETKDSFLVSTIKGKFEVRTPSLSMGLEELDKAVHSKMLFVREHPIASFEILQVRAKKGMAISIGTPTYTQVEAKFTLMGKTVRVKAPTQFEPYVNEDGDLFLHVQSTFRIQNIMEVYQIEGPPGPMDTSNNIIVKIDILLEPS